MVLKTSSLAVGQLHRLQAPLSSPSSPHISKTDHRQGKEGPPVKSVRFCETQNQFYSSSARTPEEKKITWYGVQVLDRFRREFAGAVMELETRDGMRARSWLGTLTQSYLRSIQVSTTNTALSDRPTSVASTSKISRKNSATDFQRLRGAYSQEPNLVGLEEILIPRLRKDGARRQKSLVYSIQKIYTNPRFTLQAKEYHIRLLCQQIAQPSKVFAKEIALAQFGADTWGLTPTPIVV
mmetsp:Transcript_9047/g.25070  ORF Transcript_9047/g.25070 Transcript_9047/m.25070 type:complete len:238 (+) Transcript_9047:269-982(+)